MGETSIYEPLLELITPLDNFNTYLHKTDTEETSKKIMSEGFYFVDHLKKTSDHIGSAEKVFLDYWISLRAMYGDQIIAIQMNPQRILEQVKQHIKKVPMLEQIISLYRVFDEDYEDYKYLLPKQYVKGYVDESNGLVNFNKFFNPEYVVSDDIIKRNIDEWL